MIVKRLERQKDGSMEVTWLLDKDQTSFLVNFSLEFLLAKGLIQVANVTDEELKEMEEELQNDITESFLSSLDKKQMGNA